MINITSSAQNYIFSLLSRYSENTGICIFVKKIESSCVECGIRFCLSDEFSSNDFIFQFDSFSVYVFYKDMFFLRNVKIDILENDLETQLTIKVKNIESVLSDQVVSQERFKDISDLKIKVRNFLESTINPQLALHGGSVSLIEITQDFLVVIQFFGGCNGCSMATYTIKEGIENVLMKYFPMLKGVVDSTVHNRGKHSYF